MALHGLIQHETTWLGSSLYSMVLHGMDQLGMHSSALHGPASLVLHTLALHGTAWCGTVLLGLACPCLVGWLSPALHRTAGPGLAWASPPYTSMTWHSSIWLGLARPGPAWVVWSGLAQHSWHWLDPVWPSLVQLNFTITQPNLAWICLAHSSPAWLDTLQPLTTLGLAQAGLAWSGMVCLGTAQHSSG